MKITIRFDSQEEREAVLNHLRAGDPPTQQELETVLSEHFIELLRYPVVRRWFRSDVRLGKARTK